jgi:hypothetical protein
MESIELTGGLDLVSAPLATPAGSLRDCLNYEVGWGRGYQRIDGFERFDGHTSPSTTTGWVLTIPLAEVTGTFTPVEDLVWEYQGASGVAGSLVYTTVTASNLIATVILRAGRQRPPLGAVITGRESGATFLLLTPASGAYLEDAFGTHAEYLAALDAASTLLRAEVRPVPGGSTIVGVHYHEDQVYAVRDVSRIQVLEADDAKLEVGMYVYGSYVTPKPVGEVVAVDPLSNTADISPLTSSGFVLTDGEALNVAATIRFSAGTGVEPALFSAATGPAAAWAGVIGYVTTREGGWDKANAGGQMAITGPAPALPAVGQVVTFPGGSFTIQAIYFQYAPAVLVVEEALAQATYAAMWRSTDDGWVRVDTGHTLPFEDGVVDPLAVVTVQQVAWCAFS